MKRHEYNSNMVCSCGRTYEQHQALEEHEFKWCIENFQGRPDPMKAVKELEDIISSQSTPKIT
jgi:hypothetical protein